jgi:hypothetical protein
MLKTSTTLIIYFVFILFIQALFCEVINVDPVLRSKFETVNSNGYDQYTLSLCQPAGTLIEVTVSNLDIRDLRVVFAFGGLTAYPSKDIYQEKWTTFTGDPYKPASSFIINYPGRPVYLSVIASPAVKQASYNIVVAPVTKDIKTASFKTGEKLLEYTEGLSVNTSKFLYPTFKSSVTGQVSFGGEAVYKFLICKESFPPRCRISFSSHIIGDTKSCGFNQYMNDKPNVDPIHVLPGCVDLEENTPSYVRCNGNGEWTSDYVPEAVWVMLKGFGGNGLDILNKYALSGTLECEQIPWVVKD